MASHLLKLGAFKFSVNTASYETLQRAWQFNWRSHPLVGGYPALQNTGQGLQSISLNGRIFPHEIGSHESIANLVSLGSKGEPCYLVSGYGEVFGYWTINKVMEMQKAFFPDGAARQIDFSLSLTFYGERYG